MRDTVRERRSDESGDSPEGVWQGHHDPRKVGGYVLQMDGAEELDVIGVLVGGSAESSRVARNVLGGTQSGRGGHSTGVGGVGGTSMLHCTAPPVSPRRPMPAISIGMQT